MIYVTDKACPSRKQNAAQQTEEDRYAHGPSYASPSPCQCFMPQMTFLCQTFPPFLPSLKAVPFRHSHLSRKASLIFHFSCNSLCDHTTKYCLSYSCDPKAIILDLANYLWLKK